MKSYLVFYEAQVRNVVNVYDGLVKEAYDTFKSEVEALSKSDEKTILETINKNPKGFLFNNEIKAEGVRNTDLCVGEYYSRIFRPIADLSTIPFLGNLVMSRPTSPPIDPTEYFNSVNQVLYLIDELKRIFRVVQPEKENLAVFGIEIRNIIILACTEVEAQWQGILKANQYGRGRYSTKDYVKLSKILKLQDYKLRLRNYPGIQGISPYSNWDPGKPTKSLPWYDTYNKIKHDREGNMKLATIEKAIESVLALITILIAQYGSVIANESELRSYFLLKDFPRWEEHEKYLPPSSLKSEDWQAFKYEIP